MLRVPQKQSLEKQTADILREQISAGAWGEWLPGERSLCEQLQVSRYTLRTALRQLGREGVIASERGLGNRIVRGASAGQPKAPVASEVGLLVAGELDALLPSQVMWIDHLRGMLAERGCRLHLFHGRQYAQRSPARALGQLASRHPHACWILLFSGPATQAWFQQHGVPCLVAGSIYPGISLPFCDINHHAVGRHAAGVLLGRGHRTLALVVEKSKRAGDLATEAGFSEAARKGGADLVLGYHSATAPAIAATVRRLMERTPTPTGILVVNAFHYLSVSTCLARMGCRIPDHVSVISRDGEPFFSYVLPAPAHYVTPPKTFAKAILTPLLQLLHDGQTSKTGAQIMPAFLPGQSIATVG